MLTMVVSQQENFLFTEKDLTNFFSLKYVAIGSDNNFCLTSIIDVKKRFKVCCHELGLINRLFFSCTVHRKTACRELSFLKIREKEKMNYFIISNSLVGLTPGLQLSLVVNFVNILLLCRYSCTKNEQTSQMYV